MHYGSIDNPNTVASRVYDILMFNMPNWIPARRLAKLAKTTSITTRISEVRHQLDPESFLTIEIKRERVKGKVVTSYRMDIIDA